MTRSFAITAAAFALAATVQATPAAAVSLSVKMACMTDYLNNCSHHSVGSPAVRSCMRSVGPRLSKRCISALVKAGEVSQAEVNRHKAKMKSARR